MGDELRNQLDNIESSEKESASLHEKIEKLMRIIEKQKIIMNDLESALSNQKSRSAGLVEIPEDVRELKAMMAELRVIVNEKEVEIEHLKGDIVQVQTELELSRKSILPTQVKLKESYETLTKVQTESAEKDAQVTFKQEKILSLENKINQLEITANRYKEELSKRTEDLGGKADGIREDSQKELDQLRAEYDKDFDVLREKHRNTLEELQTSFSKERQDLKAKLSELDSQIITDKLNLTEQKAEAQQSIDKYGDLRKSYEAVIKKVEQFDEIRKQDGIKIDDLKEQMINYKDFFEKNAQKITQNEKLYELMEHEPQFKAFLILEQVGAMGIEELRRALGSPMVITQRFVKKLEEVGLIETNAVGKLIVKKVVEE